MPKFIVGLIIFLIIALLFVTIGILVDFIMLRDQVLPANELDAQVTALQKSVKDENDKVLAFEQAISAGLAGGLDSIKSQTSKIVTTKPRPTFSKVPYTFMGCYGEGAARTFPNFDPIDSNHSHCYAVAKAKGSKFFGLQWSNGHGGGSAECWHGPTMPTDKVLVTTCSNNPTTDPFLWNADPRVPVPTTGYNWTNAVYKILD